MRRIKFLWALAVMQVLCLLLILIFYVDYEVTGMKTTEDEIRAIDTFQDGNEVDDDVDVNVAAKDTRVLSPPLVETDLDEENHPPESINVKLSPSLTQDGLNSPLMKPGKSGGSIPRKTKNAAGVGPLSLKQTRFVLFNGQICNSGDSISTNSTHPDPLLLILVQSRRAHFTERQTIRNTYGSLFYHKNWDIRVIFLLGKGRKAKAKITSQQTDVQIRLAWEFNSFGDIVFGPFYDTEAKFAPSTTYSHIMGLRWAMKHCNRTTYIATVNDDQFVDTLEIVERTIPTMKKADASFFCAKKESTPFENRWSDTQVEYCSDGAYLAEYQAMTKLFEMIPNIPFHYQEHDDIFVTGKLRQAFLEKTKESSSLPVDRLKILSPPESQRGNNNRCFLTPKFYEKIERYPFHKYQDPVKSSIVKEFWCLWYNALEIKGIAKFHQSKFIWATMVE